MFITTAISYLNGNPQIGHAYEIILTDFINCFFKLILKTNTYFLTGTDEHGQKIADMAVNQNKIPKELCDQNVVKFKQLYEVLDINYDNFIRTTDKNHYTMIQSVIYNILF